MGIENETPTLAQVLQDAIDAKICELHVCLPARVESYDAGTQKANVKPLLQKKYVDGRVVSLPIVNNVPVIMPRTGKAFLSLPLAPGDTVTLLFAERSLDKWKSTGGEVNPDDPRKHNLSDAFAIPGGYSFNEAAQMDASDVVLQNANTEFRLTTSGKFALKNKSGEELVSLLSDLCQAIVDAKTNTVFGPQPFVNLADFIQLKTKIDSLKL